VGGFRSRFLAAIVSNLNFSSALAPRKNAGKMPALLVAEGDHGVDAHRAACWDEARG
jgi:hypothetical protein